MPTSGANRRENKSAGFSLLEMLVVLTIMSLMLSIVSVKLVRTAESVYFHKTADAIVSEIIFLRAKAILNAEPLILVTDKSRLQQLPNNQKNIARQYKLPEGWSVTGDNIFISDTGTCFGGQIKLSNEVGRLTNFKFLPPDCRTASVENQLSLK